MCPCLSAINIQQYLKLYYQQIFEVLCLHMGERDWNNGKIQRLAGVSNLGAVVIDYKNNCYNAAISTPDDVQVLSKKIFFI